MLHFAFLHIWSRSVTWLSRVEARLFAVYLSVYYEFASRSNRIKFKAAVEELGLPRNQADVLLHTSIVSINDSPGYYSFQWFINLTAVISHRSSTKQKASVLFRNFSMSQLSECIKDRRQVYFWVNQDHDKNVDQKKYCSRKKSAMMKRLISR